MWKGGTLPKVKDSSPKFCWSPEVSPKRLDWVWLRAIGKGRFGTRGVVTSRIPLKVSGFGDDKRCRLIELFHRRNSSRWRFVTRVAVIAHERTLDQSVRCQMGAIGRNYERGGVRFGFVCLLQFVCSCSLRSLMLLTMTMTMILCSLCCRYAEGWEWAFRSIGKHRGREHVGSHGSTRSLVIAAQLVRTDVFSWELCTERLIENVQINLVDITGLERIFPGTKSGSDEHLIGWWVAQGSRT